MSYEQQPQDYIGPVRMETISFDGKFIERWQLLHPDTGDWIEVDKDQLWYWTKEWQEKEREADEDIAAGRVERFDSMEELLASLDADGE